VKGEGGLAGRPGTGRVGHGRAHAAVSILNATATGIGCSLAITGGVEATWSWDEAPGLRCDTPGADGRLSQSVASCLRIRVPTPSPGAMVATRSTFPPARGLKTSSSAAAALVQAAWRAAGAEPDAAAITAAAIAACRQAGITLTGALDDQAAVVRGGCHLTDNGRNEILQEIPVAPLWVAVWVPQACIPKQGLRGIAAAGLAPRLRPLVERVRRGDIALALTENGRAFTQLYQAHGLPVQEEPATAALGAGALGAGLSGTGPAVAALFEQPVELPPIPGGAWSWHRSVAEGVFP
jgi:shikimate kinase